MFQVCSCPFLRIGSNQKNLNLFKNENKNCHKLQKNSKKKALKYPCILTIALNEILLYIDCLLFSIIT